MTKTLQHPPYQEDLNSSDPFNQNYPFFSEKDLHETFPTLKPLQPESTLPKIPLSKLIKTHTEPPLQPDPETNPNIRIMPKTVAEDIIHLFPHSSSDLVFDITPLTSVPVQPEPSKPKLTIYSKPLIQEPQMQLPQVQQRMPTLKKGTCSQDVKIDLPRMTAW